MNLLNTIISKKKEISTVLSLILLAGVSFNHLYADEAKAEAEAEAEAEAKAESKQKVKAPKTFDEFLRKNTASMELEKDSRGTQYIASGSMNGVKGKFFLDTGSQNSSLEVLTAKKLKLETKEQLGVRSVGIGGTSKIYYTILKEFNIGPHIFIKNQPMSVSNVTAKFKDGGFDGIIGNDLFTKLNGIINFSTDRLHYASGDKAPQLQDHYKKYGYECIKLEKKSKGHHIIECKINGYNAKMILDTGAQQTVLDTAFAKKSNVKCCASGIHLVMGGGDSVKSAKMASLSLGFGEFSFDHFPALVLDLSQINNNGKEFDGTLGAEVLHASGCIYDIAKGHLYFKPGIMEAGDISMLSGEFPMNDKELKDKVDSSEMIMLCQIRSQKIGKDVVTINNKKYTKVIYTAFIKHILKPSKAGTEKIGDNIEFYMLALTEAKMEEKVRYYITRNPEKVVFFNPSTKVSELEKLPLYKDAIFTWSEFRNAQLKKIK